MRPLTWKDDVFALFLTAIICGLALLSQGCGSAAPTTCPSNCCGTMKSCTCTGDCCHPGSGRIDAEKGKAKK
jgi:hypothetical protein